MRIDDLDCKQREVVAAALHSNDRVLVLGGPGTGKTTTALWTAHTYLDASNEESPPRVLFLTFSRTAVSQIMRRAPGVLGSHADHIEILTFHGLAYRLLKGFGRYAGYGTAAPTIQSKARVKLLGNDSAKLRYDDLVPAALGILESSERVSRLVDSRWGLVICDEAQDTSTEQWQLLQAVASHKLVMLGDPNQMIYTFVPGVSPERFRQVREWADKEIELDPRSHRDPSGAIPALAEAIRQRNFEDEAVVQTLKSGRLVIHFDVGDGDYQDLLSEVIKDARKEGSHDIGIFAHSNASVAELAEQLNTAGIDHVLVGISEAHAEALASMATQCAYSLGLATDKEVRESFGLFLTASGRSTEPPVLARALAGNGSLPSLIDEGLQRIEDALVAAVDGTMDDLGRIAMQSWEGLAIKGGFRPWHRAAAHFRRLAGPLRYMDVSEGAVRQLLEIIERSRIEALIDLDYSERVAVKLMNFHQTKGREADTVVHVFRSDDYFGREGEPFTETSRLLNVAVSRARHRVIVVLPQTPHSLVEPFTALRRYACSGDASYSQ